MISGGNTHAQFLGAIRNAGLNPPDAIVEDGKLHRFATNGSLHDDAGWYVFHSDGIPAGSFGDWRTGASQSWRSDIGRELSHTEEAAYRLKVDAMRRVREDEEARRQADAAIKATAIWEQAEPASNEHPYLERKSVKSHGLRVYRGDMVVGGIACDGCLLVPMKIGKVLHSLQFIAPNGDKRFLSGGRVKGCYYSIGTTEDLKKPHCVLCIAEGYATAASIREATGDVVVAAFNAGNLAPVALTMTRLRDQYPDVRLIVCADDDASTGNNPGITKAMEAAKAIGGLLALPKFGDHRPEGATDFNDLARSQGDDAIRRCLEAATRAPISTIPTVSDLSVSNSTEWPDPKPIKAELLPVDPLPLNIIPPPFREWIKDISDRMQCPHDYVAAAMLVMVGSIIGAGCGIRPKKHDDWLVVPNLWGGVVGCPGMLKTPAIGEAMKPLEGLEARAKAEYDGAMKDHGAEVEAFKARREALQGDMRQVAKGKSSPTGQGSPTMDSLKHEFSHLEEPKGPIWRRYKTNDATIEKMSELQADNPRGFLLFRDELIGLFATWDKDGHESDRAFYLESWNGIRPYTSDRIGRGTIYVENLCVSVFGGIQPAKLSGYLHAAMRGHNNDGMVQRLQVLVYPDEPKHWTLTDHPINTAAQRNVYQVAQRLAMMDFRQLGAFSEEGQRIPYFRFDDKAQTVFYEWLTELEGKLRQDDEPVVLEHLGKYRSLMPALALEFHLITLADQAVPSPCPVSREAAEYAAAWCDYLESHARRVYGMVTNLTAQAASRLARKLQQGALPARFTVRDVYRKEWGLLDDKQVAENACEELVGQGWLREHVTPSAPGQRGKTEYLINPKVRS